MKSNKTLGKDVGNNSKKENTYIAHSLHVTSSSGKNKPRWADSALSEDQMWQEKLRQAYPSDSQHYTSPFTPHSTTGQSLLRQDAMHT